MPSEERVFSRADVGSGDSADHKTTARSTKLRPGQPHIPTLPGGNGATAPGWPWAAVGLQAALLRISARPKAVEPDRNASWRMFRWDEEPATPIAGYHGTRQTPPGPWGPTWVRRAPNPAVVAVQNRKLINSIVFKPVRAFHACNWSPSPRPPRAASSTRVEGTA